MTKNEYKNTYKKFMKSDDVFYVSEHRKSYENKIEFKNTLQKNLDIILMPISVTRFEAEKAKNYFNRQACNTGSQGVGSHCHPRGQYAYCSHCTKGQSCCIGVGFRYPSLV